MKKVYKSIISIILVVSMLICAVVPAFAAEAEEYICELRLIYAEDYDEALEILSEGEFSVYKLLNENLNEDSDEIGVWLAYKTTTNIDDAITDIAVMPMGGGYTTGNYKEMLQNSYDEYLSMGLTYLDAIEYFVEAYDAGDYFAEAAYRQLNFYTVKTQEGIGLDIPAFEGELLGDIFYNGIAEDELATIFMQGNVYALKNIRSLLAMGVSYNDDGLTYMEKVAIAAAEMDEDPTVFDDEDFEDLLPNIAALLTTLRDQFKELESVEDEFDWTDDNFTQEEIKYSEITYVATLMRDTEYLNGKTLYEFCMDYDGVDTQSSELYPLAAALNVGQVALTKVFHYYDVIRYSISDMSPDVIEERLAEMEETYSEEPFNVYAGVDRSIYDGSFALTSAANRADGMNEYSLEEILFGEAASLHTKIANGVGCAGLGITIFALCRSLYYKLHLVDAADAAGSSANQAMIDALNYTDKALDGLSTTTVPGIESTYGEMTQGLMQTYCPDVDLTTTSFAEQIQHLEDYLNGHFSKVAQNDAEFIENLSNTAQDLSDDAFAYDAAENYSYSKVLYGGGTTFTAILYIVGGVMMLYSAINLGLTVYNYYHPDYDDVPIAMVDYISTIDGDRYIKYDVVYNAETNDDGIYEAGDLNAFEGKRWNALYYTKSYEAGKPLLADNFVVSNNNNKAASGYTPVHRFGEVVCYDLNKYNFDGDTNIYLSVKQSKNDKSAVADVPEVVGSMFGAGFLFLAGGIGAIAGVGGVLATQKIIKKKKSEEESSEPSAVETSEE